MKSVKVKLFLIVTLLSMNLFAQGEATVPVLTLSHSPQLFGMGQVGAAITFDDPSAYYHNPANLGFQSREINFAFSFLPQEINWLGNFGNGYPKLSITSFMLGYKFKNKPFSCFQYWDTSEIIQNNIEKFGLFLVHF